jgi:hypothetical protein
MVRAKTIDTQGNPGLTGEVGGMYLRVGVKRGKLPIVGYPTLPPAPMAYEDRSYH